MRMLELLSKATSASERDELEVEKGLMDSV